MQSLLLLVCASFAAHAKHRTSNKLLVCKAINLHPVLKERTPILTENRFHRTSNNSFVCCLLLAVLWYVTVTVTVLCINLLVLLCVTLRTQRMHGHGHQ